MELYERSFLHYGSASNWKAPPAVSQCRCRLRRPRHSEQGSAAADSGAAAPAASVDHVAATPAAGRRGR